MFLELFKDISSKYVESICLVDYKIHKEYTKLLLYNFPKQIFFKLNINSALEGDYATIDLFNAIKYLVIDFSLSARSFNHLFRIISY